MYFILSKVLFVFVSPLFWVFVSLLYAAITRKAKRKQQVLIYSLIALYLFSTKFSADLFAKLWDVGPNRSPGKGYSAVIVLGGIVSEDGKGNPFFNAASERYHKGLELYQKGIVKKFLFTGGNASLQPNKFTEAAFIKTELKKAGVPDSAVLLDNKARNTEENAAYSKLLLQQSGLKPPYLLVTSGFHMRRAKLIFKKKGLEIVPYTCHYLTSPGTNYTEFIPGPEALDQWTTYIKEIIGYVVALFR